MAMNNQTLLDMLKLKEEEPIMSEMAPVDQNRLAEIPPSQPEPQQPLIPNDTPQEQVFTTPKLTDILPAKAEQPETPMLAEVGTQPTPLAIDDTKTPMSKSEALIAEYQKMLGKDQQSLEEARSRDRMLKIGGSIGDALATYLNAKSQMNVKAPGVQVQQGAGLGKVADMFATAPEIASDIKDRREALLKQYTAMAKKDKEITPYQAESLKLKKEDQKLREKNIEELNKRFGAGLEFRKGAQEFKEKEKNELSDKQVESMASFDKVQGLSDELKIRADQFKDKLGPYAASIEQYKSLVPGFQEDPDFAAFRASTTDTLSQYIKSLSGLTVSDKERAALLQSVPTVTDKYDIFMSKMTELQKRLDRYRNSELEAAKKYQGKNVPEQKNVEQQTQQNTIKRFDPKSQRNVEYDAVTKKPIRFVD